MTSARLESGPHPGIGQRVTACRNHRARAHGSTRSGLEIAHFVDVLEGIATPIVTFEDARRTLEVIHAAYASLESGTGVAPRGAPLALGGTAD